MRKNITSKLALLVFTAASLTIFTGCATLTDDDATFFTSVGNDSQTISLNKPEGVSLHKVGSETVIYISNSESHSILKITPEGTLLNVYGKDGQAGESTWTFDTPKGIDVDSQGNVYVADTTNSRVVKFHPDETVNDETDASNFHVFGEPGASNTQLNYPTDVVVYESEGSNFLFISDLNNARIQRIDSSVSNPGTPASFSVGDFAPWGLNCFDTTLVVTNKKTEFSQVHILDITLVESSTFGSEGSGSNNLNSPKGISSDADFLYICDYLNKRIKVTTKTGDFVKFLSGTFENPVDIDVNDTYIVVVDDGGVLESSTGGIHIIKK